MYFLDEQTFFLCSLQQFYIFVHLLGSNILFRISLAGLRSIIWVWICPCQLLTWTLDPFNTQPLTTKHVSSSNPLSDWCANTTSQVLPLNFKLDKSWKKKNSKNLKQHSKPYHTVHGAYMSLFWHFIQHWNKCCPANSRSANRIIRIIPSDSKSILAKSCFKGAVVQWKQSLVNVPSIWQQYKGIRKRQENMILNLIFTGLCQPP